MTDNKLTDKDVKKALECCDYTTSCPEDCPLKCLNKRGVLMCGRVLKKSLLDLINRLEIENENYSHNIKNLTEENRQLQSHVKCLKKYDEQRDIALHSRLTATARAEAIKEFAERLKNFGYKICKPNGDWVTVVKVINIDNLVKEMVGDKN